MAAISSSFNTIPLSAPWFYTTPIVDELTPNILESQFRDIICCNVDANSRVFQDFFFPNEYQPKMVQRHLAKMSSGFIVSVGSERSLFDYLLSPEQCEGLIIRDINPRIKGYIDFLVLLLRISKTQEEFISLAAPKCGEYPYLAFLSPCDQPNIDQQVWLLEQKLEIDTEIPQFMKDYYFKNLQSFAEIFYPVSKGWAMNPLSGDFEGVNYYKDDQLFARLQNAAKTGRIIATIGSINDLSFLRGQRVGIVDTSNVDDYCLIDLQGCDLTSTRVIWTDAIYMDNAKYFSYIPQNLLIEERRELDERLRIIREKKSFSSDQFLALWLKKSLDFPQTSIFEQIPEPSYSRKTLEVLRRFMDNPPAPPRKIF